MLQIFKMGPIGSLAFVAVTAGPAMNEAAATHCDRGQDYGEQVRARLPQLRTQSLATTLERSPA
jgi:hypothetical protein